MTDESGDPQPRKLKLSSSRNQPDTQGSVTTPKTSTPTTPTPQVESKPKVTLRPASATATPSAVAATPLADAPAPKPKQAAPTQVTPPPLKKSPAPRSGNTPSKSSEQVARPIPSPPPKDDPLGSLLIVAGLLFILAAAAGGIWYLFQSDPSEPTEDAVEEATAPSNSIERAKATIDSVPDRTLDAVIDAPEVPKAETVTTAEVPEVAPTEQLKEAISEYLQNLHIGGVRTGARARIMLNGQNYDINDTVDATTGLKFIGTRNQKLLFKDPNGVTYVKSF
mgnify:CR=1 FL=1